jgi:predicted phosphodiesterase
LEKDSSGIYIAYIDSCFLGDTEENNDSTFGTVRYDQSIAKGKLSIQQTEKLLEWYDRGVRGSLPDPNNNDNMIDKNIFANSLKVLVMHHYLFEPPEHKSDYFMRLRHRDVVFRNIAFSDFDMLLCGHKHIPAFDVHSYGNYFDSRARNRYLLNYFRRLIGLHSMPLQISNDIGQRWSKSLTLMSQTILKFVRKMKPNASVSTIANSVLDLLKQGLQSPDTLERNVKQFIHTQGVSAAEVIEPYELKEIQRHIAIGLTVDERKQLKIVADRINKSIQNLYSRPFLQIMSGSCSKACSEKNKQRTYNVIKLSCHKKKWNVVCERNIWDWQSKQFLSRPLTQTHTFEKNM